MILKIIYIYIYKLGWKKKYLKFKRPVPILFSCAYNILYFTTIYKIQTPTVLYLVNVKYRSVCNYRVEREGNIIKVRYEYDNYIR